MSHFLDNGSCITCEHSVALPTTISFLLVRSPDLQHTFAERLGMRLLFPHSPSPLLTHPLPFPPSSSPSSSLSLSLFFTPSPHPSSSPSLPFSFLCSSLSPFLQILRGTRRGTHEGRQEERGQEEERRQGFIFLLQQHHQWLFHHCQAEQGEQYRPELLLPLLLNYHTSGSATSSSNTSFVFPSTSSLFPISLSPSLSFLLIFPSLSLSFLPFPSFLDSLPVPVPLLFFSPFPLLLAHPLPCCFSQQLTLAGSGGQGSRYHHREVPPRFQHQKQTKQQKYSKSNQGRYHQLGPLSCS